MMYSDLTRSKASSASLPFSGASVLCGLSVPAHAQIITEDMEAEINTLHQYIKMTEQYLMQGKQYATQIDQYIQQAKNAKGLGGVLKAITGDDFTNIDSGEKGIKAAHDLIYNLDPDQDGGYVKKARALLEKVYDLPKEVDSAQQQIDAILNHTKDKDKKPGSDDPSSPNFDSGNRDVNNVVEIDKEIDKAFNNAQKLNDEKVAKQEAIIRDLSDDDLGSSAQVMAAELNTIEYQNFDVIRLERAIATNQQLDRIHQLEADNKAAEKTLAALKKVQEYTINDGKKSSDDKKNDTKKG